MDIWLLISIVAFVLAVFFAGIMIPQILLISFRKKLFDVPDARKIHHGVVPRLGGIAFMPVMFLVMALLVGIGELFHPGIVLDMIPPLIRPCAFCFCSLLILWIVGMADDLVGVRYRAKFVVQIICALLMIGGAVYFNNFHGLFGLGMVSPFAGVPITVLLTVLIINSINLIDGIDGLASGLCSIALLLYGTMFFLKTLYLPAIMAFCGLGVLVPFFYFNVFGDAEKHKKIFMGDTGSLTIGMIITICVMLLLKCDTVDIFTNANMMVVAFSPLIVPCFDVVRVYFYRIKKHRNPFLPDKSHIHHLLLRRGWSQRKAMLSIIGFSLALSLANIILSVFININIIVLLDIILWVSGIYIVYTKEKPEDEADSANNAA